jgi:hypothetical protein
MTHVTWIHSACDTQFAIGLIAGDLEIEQHQSETVEFDVCVTQKVGIKKD